MRQQSTKNWRDNPYSINIINEVSDFLVSFVSDNKQDMIRHDKVADLIINCLDLLSEASIGPCFGNQRLLIKNKRLLDVLNEVLRIDLVDYNDLVSMDNVGLITFEKNRIKMLTEVINVSSHSKKFQINFHFLMIFSF